MLRRCTHPLARLILLLPVVSLVGSCGINNIPTYDQELNDHWSQVQKQYTQRANLIPEIIDAVLEVSSEKNEVLLIIEEAHADARLMNVSPEMLNNPDTFLQFQQTQLALHSALQRLPVVVETYPELTDSKNFLSVQQQLKDTENNLDIARRNYSAAVQRYNTELRAIPGRWWAQFMYPDSKVKASFTISHNP